LTLGSADAAAGLFDLPAFLFGDALGALLTALLADLLLHLVFALVGVVVAGGQELALLQTAADFPSIALAARPQRDQTSQKEPLPSHVYEIVPEIPVLVSLLPGHRAGTACLVPGADAMSPAVMRENIRLVSSAGTGFTYYTTKNKRTQTNKIEMKKYDPVKRQHVVFKETKMPPHSK
jgi:large subunit ribosomal protein L33